MEASASKCCSESELESDDDRREAWRGALDREAAGIERELHLRREARLPCPGASADRDPHERRMALARARRDRRHRPQPLGAPRADVRHLRARPGDLPVRRLGDPQRRADVPRHPRDQRTAPARVAFRDAAPRRRGRARVPVDRHGHAHPRVYAGRSDASPLARPRARHRQVTRARGRPVGARRAHHARRAVHPLRLVAHRAARGVLFDPRPHVGLAPGDRTLGPRPATRARCVPARRDHDLAHVVRQAAVRDLLGPPGRGPPPRSEEHRPPPQARAGKRGRRGAGGGDEHVGLHARVRGPRPRHRDVVEGASPPSHDLERDTPRLIPRLQQRATARLGDGLLRRLHRGVLPAEAPAPRAARRRAPHGGISRLRTPRQGVPVSPPHADGRDGRRAARHPRRDRANAAECT